MNQTALDRVYWTARDLELLPDDRGTRHEIVEGELLVTRAPHSKHQQTCGRIFGQLDRWSEASGLGETILCPEALFSDIDNVIPDVVWVTLETYANFLDESGHLTSAPELVIEVLSQSPRDRIRDREVKRKLYSVRGVREYWIADWQSRQLEIYRRERNQLQLVATLSQSDIVTSPLLRGFSCVVAKFFPR